jgi:autotransporter-associated beta strand protein
MRFNGTGGIAALNESSTTTTFFQRAILANDLIFRASNSAGGGFRWGGPSLAGAPFAGLDLAGHTVTFDTVNAANAMSFANAFIIQGAGNVIKTGAGTLTIGNVSQYTGSTVIDAGTLALTGSGSIASSSGLHNDGVFDIAGTTSGTSIKTLSGAGVVNIGTKALTLTNANGDTFAGSFSGSGGLTLASGTQTLTGDSSAFSGLTTVQSGTLSVNGALGGTMNVLSGGTLQGNGIVGDTTINAGGTLAPGNSIGLLTVQGNLVFGTASSYMVEVSPDNAGRTNVTGIATLSRATVNAHFAAGSYIARQYTILNATGGLGGSSFNTLANTDLPANFSSSLSYDNNNAYLNLTLNFIPPPNSGLNVNQQNVGNAIVGFFNSTGGIPLVFGALSPQGLTQVSGEVATGSQQATFDAMNLFMGLMTDPFNAGRGDGAAFGGHATGYAEDTALSYQRGRKPNDPLAAIYTKAPPRAPSFAQRWSVWAAGYGGSQTTDGNAGVGSNTATSRMAGTAVGADYRFSPDTLVGFALAGGGTNFSVASGGSGRSDLFQAGAFLRHTVGPAYISAALAYGWQDVTTDRSITIAGVDQLRAKFNANAFSGRLEGGYRFVTPVLGITPYAAAQFTTFDLPAYAEQALSGTDTFALSYGAKSVTASRSELGVRTDRSWAMTDAILTVRGRVAWAHDFNPDRNIAATLQTLPGASFVVNGAAQAQNAALTTASAEMKWLNGFSLAATFEGEFSDVTESYAGKGVVHYAW